MTDEMMKSINRNDDIPISWQILRDEYYVHPPLMQTVKLIFFVDKIFNKVFPKFFFLMKTHGFFNISTSF